MSFVSFWRNCERMDFVSSRRTYESMGFVSFWRNCERMGFVSSVFGVPVNLWNSSVFGVPVNVRISSVLDVPVIVWFRQFLAYL